MSYRIIRDEAARQEIVKKKDLAQQQRTALLYASISRDMGAILKILLPDGRARTVGNHLKSIMYNLIELKIGKRPDKF